MQRRYRNKSRYNWNTTRKIAKKKVNKKIISAGTGGPAHRIPAPPMSSEHQVVSSAPGMYSQADPNTNGAVCGNYFIWILIS